MTKRCVVLFAVALVIACLPAMAARVSVQPITHETGLVYQAYAGNSDGADLAFLGYLGTGSDVITAVPGILSIVPGAAWMNFVGAANENSEGGLWALGYTIKNVVLQKKTPSFIQCNEVYAPKTITQQGTKAIRTWWPLMYEAPGTIWTLTILYGTAQQKTGPNPNDVLNYDDDGSGPNPGSPVHQETWKWQLDVTFESLQSVLSLFHEIPFGLDEVPVISDEGLFCVLQDKISGVIALLASGDNAGASLLLGDFELEVQDACIGSSPASPAPSGIGTGIAQTSENPACCKLLVDVEYLSAKYSVFLTKK